MVKRALVERRPWLLVSLVAALAWWAFGDSQMVPGLFKMAWKAVPLACLAVYAFQRHLGPDGTILTAMLAIAAMADAMTELIYAAAGTLMTFSLLLAIWLYSRNRRETTSLSQKGLGLALVLVLPAAAWVMLAGEDGRLLVTGFSLMLAIMAAMAWTSRFSRYRVGAGAMLFVLSQFVLFAITGPIWRASEWGELLVWPLYYSGQLLITTGVVGRLRRDAAA